MKILFSAGCQLWDAHCGDRRALQHLIRATKPKQGTEVGEGDIKTLQRNSRRSSETVWMIWSRPDDNAGETPSYAAAPRWHWYSLCSLAQAFQSNTTTHLVTNLDNTRHLRLRTQIPQKLTKLFLHFYSTKYHTQQPLYITLELLMMGMAMAETCWANNKICNKNLCCI